MNLYHHYPHIYWQCAVLTVNASANEDDSDGTTNYGKIAKAIGDMRHKNVHVALPAVNYARFGFAPDATNDRIIFGLKAMHGVGDDAAAQIIANRPYSSLDDFYAKNTSLSHNTMVTLIKGGALDELAAKPRREIMADYILRKAKELCPPKDKLTMQNYKEALSLGIIPKSLEFECMLTNFKAHAFSKEFKVDELTYYADFSSRMFYENVLFKFFTHEHVSYEGDTVLFYKKPFDKFYKGAIEPLRQWITSPEALTAFNETSVIQKADELWQKSCEGTIPHWEMDSLSFYYTEHELAHVDAAAYGLSNFSEIPADPIVIGQNTVKGRTWDKYQIYRIAGTVLDKNKNKHTATLLTTDGVVTVKFYAEEFAFYDKAISRIKSDGKKETLEKSWLSRGNMLLITGIRRGDNFFPKRYNDSIYQHTTCLIKGVYHGQLDLQQDRAKP